MERIFSDVRKEFCVERIKRDGCHLGPHAGTHTRARYA